MAPHTKAAATAAAKLPSQPSKAEPSVATSELAAATDLAVLPVEVAAKTSTGSSDEETEQSVEQSDCTSPCGHAEALAAGDSDAESSRSPVSGSCSPELDCAEESSLRSPQEGAHFCQY
jgi:hypothetical protein